MPEILSRFTYPHAWGFKRKPVRPLDLQVLDFEKNYDYETIWNDAVQVSNNALLLVGPPLYQTAQWLHANCKFFDNNAQPLTWSYSDMDRVSVIRIETHDWMKELTLVTPYGKHQISVNYPTNVFADKKVVVTINRDNPISWIQQWIDYNKTVHNIEGLLLYNNRSTIYSANHLENMLKRDDVMVKVVEYDVPYGVLGGGDWEWQGRKGTYLPWDSDFGQYVMLEHAKWRYLHSARLVINADIDELLVVKNSNLDGVADYCQSGEHSVLVYDGIWIEPRDSRTGAIAKDLAFDDRKFYNYWHTQYGDGRGIGIKWVLNPKKNLHYQWHMHKIYGPYAKTNEITYGHYFAMNTGWCYPRDDFAGEVENLIELESLKHNLALWQQKSQGVK